MRHRVVGADSEHRPEWERRLREGEAAIGRGDLASAERLLVGLDEAIDGTREEPELHEFPRDLIGYVPTGERGAPTPEEEEPLSNRLLLVGRLVEVRRSEGRRVDGWVATLSAAREALRAGDRATARRLCDEVHARVEAADEGGAGRET